jgi:hypothetical protein
MRQAVAGVIGIQMPLLKREHVGNLLLVSMALPAGLMCAVAPAYLPWWAPIALLCGMCLLAVTARYPFAGLVLTFFLAFEAIPGRFAPEIPLAVFKLKPYELVFLWTIFVLAIKIAMTRDEENVRMPMFTLPVLFILVCVAVGVVYGKYFRVNGDLVLAEGRGFLAVLAAPMVQLIIRNHEEMRRLCNWICVMGVLVAIYIILQYAAGIPILGGRYEALDSANRDVMRSITPGVSVQVFALFYMTLSLVSGRRFRFWLIPLLIIVLLGLLGTFGRGVWMTTAVGALIVAFLAGRWKGLALAAVLGVALVGTTLSAAYVLNPRAAEAAIERAVGIGNEVTEGGSWGWRKRENSRALEVIGEHPLLGVGLGGAYKNLALIEDPSFGLEAYFIHNSYLYFPLKMGVLAGLWPFMIATGFGLLLLRLYRQTSGRVGNVVAVCAAMVSILFVAALAGPTIRNFPGLLMLGTAMALCAVTYRLSGHPEQPRAGAAQAADDELPHPGRTT